MFTTRIIGAYKDYRLWVFKALFFYHSPQSYVWYPRIRSSRSCQLWSSR